MMPPSINVRFSNDESHSFTVVVLKVLSHNLLGHPHVVEVIEDGQPYDVSDGHRYMTGFIPTEVLKDNGFTIQRVDDA